MTCNNKLNNFRWDKDIETLYVEILKKLIPKYMKFLVLEISGE